MDLTLLVFCGFLRVSCCACGVFDCHDQLRGGLTSRKLYNSYGLAGPVFFSCCNTVLVCVPPSPYEPPRKINSTSYRSPPAPPVRAPPPPNWQVLVRRVPIMAVVVPTLPRNATVELEVSPSDILCALRLRL